MIKDSEVCGVKVKVKTASKPAVVGSALLDARALEPVLTHDEPL